MKTILAYNPNKEIDTSMLEKDGLYVNTTNPAMFEKLLVDNRFSSIFIFGEADEDNKDRAKKAISSTDCLTLFNPGALGNAEFFSSESDYNEVFNSISVQKKIKQGYSQKAIADFLLENCSDAIKDTVKEGFIAEFNKFLNSKTKEIPEGILLRAVSDEERFFCSLGIFSSAIPVQDILTEAVMETGENEIITGLGNACERIDYRFIDGKFLEYVFVFAKEKNWVGNAVINVEVASEDYFNKTKELFDITQEEVAAAEGEATEDTSSELTDAMAEIDQLKIQLQAVLAENQEIREKLKQRESLIMKLRESRA